MKKLLIIYMGGTIGMEPDTQTGTLVPKRGLLRRNIKRLQQQNPVVNEERVLVEVEEAKEVVDSSDMLPSDWIEIASCVGKHYEHFDGFVVLMGTDTMAYAASAVSFLLENLDKPVIFSGSMVPLVDGAHSDGVRNLLISMETATDEQSPGEVCIFIHNRLYRANRTKKVSSMHMRAFQSPNFPELARIEVKKQFRKHLYHCSSKQNHHKHEHKYEHGHEHQHQDQHQDQDQLIVHKHLSSKIVCLALIPGFSDDVFADLANNALLDAIVLQLYGTGNGPTRKASFLNAIDLMVRRGILVCVVSQCLVGSVDTSYATGYKLLEMGCVSCGDMTLEATCTKLAFLFGQGYSTSEVAHKLKQNLRGELSIGIPQSENFTVNIDGTGKL